jgi:hypothetical protein
MIDSSEEKEIGLRDLLVVRLDGGDCYLQREK